MIRRSLIIFVRRPELGKVKTRIAKEVGDELALQVYCELLRHTREVVQQVDTQRLLYYTHVVHDDEWSSDHFVKRTQTEGDLGHKMKSAFTDALQESDRAVIIGSDCAQLSPAIIEASYKALDDHDIVIGPSMDGGYYLLGMKRVHDFLFDDMTWSTDSVCSTTISRAEQHGLSYHRLTELSDIDYWSDWEKYGWELPG